jgi:hypothetical protein
MLLRRQSSIGGGSNRINNNNSRTYSFGQHLRFIIISSLLFLFIGVIYAKFFRYSLFRPIWYVQGSQIAEETRKDALAQEYIHSFKEKIDLFAGDSDESASVCLVIASAVRQKDYVFRTVAAATLAASNAKKKGILVRATLIQLGDNHLCERLQQFSENTNFQCVTRSQVAEGIKDQKFLTGVRATEEYHPEDTGRWLARERLDYALSLDWCTRAHKDPVIVALEDDGLLSSDAFERIIPATKQLDEIHPKWVVLRLYSSDFWEGWETVHTPILIKFAFAGACLTSLLSKFFLNSNPDLTKQSKQKVGFLFVTIKALFCGFSLTRVLYFIYGFIWFLIGPLIIGKQHLPIIGTQTTGGIVPEDMSSPGAVGLAFSRWFAIELVSKMMVIPAVGQTEVDLFITDQTPLGYGFELLPNVVDHIGFVSSSLVKTGYFTTQYYHPHHIMSGSFHRSAGTPF